jgi:hypothetical protein
MTKKDQIFVRLGDVAKELGISQRSLERFISNRNGQVKGRYQMPDTKAFIYDSNEFISFFKSCLRTPNKPGKPIDLFKNQKLKIKTTEGIYV